MGKKKKREKKKRPRNVGISRRQEEREEILSVVVALLAEDEFDEAIEILESEPLIRNDPDGLRLLHNAAMEVGDMGLLLEANERLVNVCRNDPEAHLNRAA